MSTPFPMEEAAQENNLRPTWNPWNGPASPHWYSGLGFDEENYYLGPAGAALRAAGAGAAKGEAVLGGLLRASPEDAQIIGEPQDNRLADAIAADAKERVKALTPDAGTTGAAAQLLHGLVSGGTEMAIGGLMGGLPGAAAMVGSGEGTQRYHELIDAGVDPATARESALLTGAGAAAGAVLPVGFGASLAAKVVTGAASQAAFGLGSRYADHQILESAGYPEMAAQQKVIDGTQMLTDLVLGAAFGGLAHLHESPQAKALRDAPGARDAALTTNLALKDRQAAPGIATDPAAANAHQAALEKGIADLMQGKPVDVSAAGVTETDFVERPTERNPEILQAIKDSITEGHLFGEENERDVQAILEGREPPPRDTSQPLPPIAADSQAPDSVLARADEVTGAAPPPATEKAIPSINGEEAPQGAAADHITQILTDRPDLTIPDENGNPVSAREALDAANEDLATETRESTVAAKAAISCYMRRGN